MSSMMLLAITITIIGAGTIAALGYAFFSPALVNKERIARRIKAIAQDGKAGKSGITGLSVEKLKDKRKAVQDSLKDIETKQKSTKQRLTMKERIDRAGLELTLKSFYIASAVTGLCIGAMFLGMGYDFIISGGLAFVGALGLPRWTIGFIAARRQKAFSTEFANSVDIIVRGVKSGLPLNECLQIIANESPAPVGPEFKDLVDSQRMGVTLDQCLEKLFERMPIPEVNFFAIVLTIQQKTGGNLSEALGNLSAVLRARKRMQAKIKAMSSEAKASAGIIGSLPPGVMLMVYVTTPDYIMLLFSETLGNVMLIGSALWMGAGILFMKKMISFKF